jgi:hypothetical protein
MKIAYIRHFTPFHAIVNIIIHLKSNDLNRTIKSYGKTISTINLNRMAESSYYFIEEIQFSFQTNQLKPKPKAEQYWLEVARKSHYVKLWSLLSSQSQFLPNPSIIEKYKRCFLSPSWNLHRSHLFY